MDILLQLKKIDDKEMPRMYAALRAGDEAYPIVKDMCSYYVGCCEMLIEHFPAKTPMLQRFIEKITRYRDAFAASRRKLLHNQFEKQDMTAWEIQSRKFMLCAHVYRILLTSSN